MREGPKLGVDACGVSGFTRPYRQASLPLRHSFCTLLRRMFLGRRFYIYYKSFFASIKLFYKHLDHFVVH